MKTLKKSAHPNNTLKTLSASGGRACICFNPCMGRSGSICPWKADAKR